MRSLASHWTGHLPALFVIQVALGVPEKIKIVEKVKIVYKEKKSKPKINYCDDY